MTNAMPMLTDSEREMLIRVSHILEDYPDNDPRIVQLMQVARAALMAPVVADVVAWNHPSEERTCTVNLREFHLQPGPLYTAPPVPALKLIELPSAFTPCISVVGPSPISAMRLDHMGGWLNKVRVISAIRTAGYEVKE